MRLLVTGGTGYIGSHCAAVLLEAGQSVTIVDDLSNSTAAVVDRIEALTGQRPGFHKVDLTDRTALEGVFNRETFDAVLHFAGLKSVGESVAKPLAYYRVNVGGAESLLTAMSGAGVKRLVFSSSATVYGDQSEVPISEAAPKDPASPYGQTKLAVERMLGDVARSDPGFRYVALRYFNPTGAHPSGLLGESPFQEPTNLVPRLTQYAVGRIDRLDVFGNDYPTPDGTCLRDYIHVMDLARGHLAALQALSDEPIQAAYNLGTGTAASVLEVIAAMERASGRELPYAIAPRRPGDVAVSCADPSAAELDLGWRAELDLDQMCADAWRWQVMNPAGY